MTVALYHVTSAANADHILRFGFNDERRGFLSDSELIGVWLAERPLDENEGARGDVCLHVEFHCGEDALLPFEVFEDGKPYREWLILAAFVNSHATVKIAMFPARMGTNDAEVCFHN